MKIFWRYLSGKIPQLHQCCLDARKMFFFSKFSENFVRKLLFDLMDKENFDVTSLENEPKAGH